MKTYTNTTSPFDAFKILDNDRNEMPVTHNIPQGYERYLIPGSTIYSATGHPGTLLFQEIAYPDYTFWLSNYFTKVREKVMGELSEPSLEVQFILSGDLLYRLKGFDWQKLEESQYNLLSIPYIENEVYFDNKDYFTFDIHPSIGLLEKIASKHPSVKKFIKMVNSDCYVQLFESHRFATPKMLYQIKKILEHLNRRQEISPNLDTAVGQLIELALVNTEGDTKPRVNFFDVEKLYVAEKMMIKHMDDRRILETQIGLSHIYKGKFREGFRQIFNELPHVYLRRKRMEKAKYLLEHYPNLKIKDIAERVGYLNANYFSTIFKNFYGISPREYRNTSRF